MLITVLGIVTDVSVVTPENALAGICLTVEPIFTVVRGVLPGKTTFICKQLSALKFNVVRFEQSLNAELPIRDTACGIVMVVKPVQPENAALGMRLTLAPIFTVVKEVHPLAVAKVAELPAPVINKQLSALKFTVVSPEQFLNAKPKMFVIGAGIVTDVSPEQPLNALVFIFPTA